MVLVDSSVWIEALRRRGDLATKVALEALLEVDGALVTGPILLEVLGLLWDLRVFAADRHFDILESRERLRRYRPGPGGAYSDA